MSSNRMQDLFHRNQVLQTAIGRCSETRAEGSSLQEAADTNRGEWLWNHLSGFAILVTAYNRQGMNLENIMLQHRKTNIVCFQLYETLGIGKLMETESRMMVPMG